MSSKHILYRVNKYCKFVYGNTFAVKEHLKALGGVWSPAIKQWVFPLTTDLSPLSAVAELRNADYQPSRDTYHFCCKNAVMSGRGSFFCNDHGFWVKYGAALYTGD